MLSSEYRLSVEARAAKVDIPSGEFHQLLYKLIDPDWSNHAGRRFSRFIDKAFGTPSNRKCTSGLCSLSPEAKKAIKYDCNCEVSEYDKKKADMDSQRPAPPMIPGYTQQ